MKKLLILLVAATLIGCDKDEDLTLTQAEQEIENAKLVGEWEGMGSEYDKCSLIFTESFEMTIIYPSGDEVCCKYHLAKDMMILEDGEYFDWGSVLYYYYFHNDKFASLYISNAGKTIYPYYWHKMIE